MRFFAILPYCNIWQDLATTFFWKFSSSLNVKHLRLVRASLCLDGNQHRKMPDLIFGVSPKAGFELIFNVISLQHVATSWNNIFPNFSAGLRMLRSCWDICENIIQSKPKWHQMFLKVLLWHQTTIFIILASFHYILIFLKTFPTLFSFLIGFMSKIHLILAIYH